MVMIPDGGDQVESVLPVPFMPSISKIDDAPSLFLSLRFDHRPFVCCLGRRRQGDCGH